MLLNATRKPPALALLTLLTLPLTAPLAQAQKPIPVEVISPQVTTLSESIEVPGSIRARQAITLRAPVSEVVRAVHFREGQTVAAGDLLVKLARADERAALATAEAEREDAKLALKRIDELARSRAVSQSERDSARVRQLMAEAQVDAAKAALNDREIRAPFAGRLGLSDIAVGSYLNAGDTITSLHDLSALEVEFDLPQAQLEMLTAEARIGFRLPNSAEDNNFEATLQSTASALDMQQRALRVRATTAANPDLRPGLAVVVSVQSANREAMTIPESALVPRGGEQLVFRIDASDIAVLIPVQTGLRREGQVEIRHGLSASDRVVVRGADRLRPGGAVEARPFAQR